MIADRTASLSAFRPAGDPITVSQADRRRRYAPHVTDPPVELDRLREALEASWNEHTAYEGALKAGNPALRQIPSFRCLLRESATEIADGLEHQVGVSGSRPPVDEGGPEADSACPAGRVDVDAAVGEDSTADGQVELVERCLGHPGGR